MKFGNLVGICFWLNLVVKGLRTPFCKLIIWFEEDLPAQRFIKSYHLPRQLNGTFFEPEELKRFISLYITGAAIDWYCSSHGSI